jgi:hypothetical protein
MTATIKVGHNNVSMDNYSPALSSNSQNNIDTVNNNMPSPNIASPKKRPWKLDFNTINGIPIKKDVKVSNKSSNDDDYSNISKIPKLYVGHALYQKLWEVPVYWNMTELTQEMKTYHNIDLMNYPFHKRYIEATSYLRYDGKAICYYLHALGYEVSAVTGKSDIQKWIQKDMSHIGITWEPPDDSEEFCIEDYFEIQRKYWSRKEYGLRICDCVYCTQAYMKYIGSQNVKDSDVNWTGYDFCIKCGRICFLKGEYNQPCKKACHWKKYNYFLCDSSNCYKLVSNIIILNYNITIYNTYIFQ